MTHADAVAFVAPTGPFHGTWADVGAGTGTFSRALAQLLGPTGAVIAIDTNERALAQLRRHGAGASEQHAQITALRGDMHALSAIEELAATKLDGILFANVLHYTRTPDAVLAQAGRGQVGGMDKEIAAGMDAINARFDRVDARFERIDGRFDQVDRRFDEERAKTAGHFEAQQTRIDRRFDLLAEDLESRFATLQRRGAREQ